MTPVEFRQLVAEKTDDQLLGLCLHDDITPYVFEPKPDAWDAFRAELVKSLGVARDDVTVVGSARLGFSLKPWANLKVFDERSDIDVLVVNPVLFDEVWLALLRAAYPRRPVTEQMPGGWLVKRQSELYTGWLWPPGIRLDAKIFGKRVRPVLDFRTRWFNTFKQASRHPPRRHEDITGRLYRTWDHADLYHLNSLALLRESLAA